MREDDIIKEYAEKAERIYEDRTAGDYTWVGLLAGFLMTVQPWIKIRSEANMHEYVYKNNGDSRLYENQPDMHDLDTCTVWVLHMSIRPTSLDSVLKGVALLESTTGEYGYGDSWTEWTVEAADDNDRHLTIYFRAEPERAKSHGGRLARFVRFLAAESGEGRVIPPHAISTSGDWAEQIKE